MSFGSRVALRVVVTLTSTVLGFVIGFVAFGAWWDRHVYPELAARSPHDGLLGLEGMMKATSGGAFCAVIVLFIGFIWVLSTSRSPAK